MAMDHPTHVAHLRAEISRLGAIPADRLHQMVPSCPDWTGEDLVLHLGSVHRWATTWLRTPPDGDFPPFPEQPDAHGAALVDWLTDGADALVAALADSDPDRPCGSFMGPTTIAWWARRQAVETALHRWDAQLLGPRTDPIEVDLAVDAIDEWCWFREHRPSPPAGTIHLHATDTDDGEWFLEPGDEFRWRRGHVKGDVAVRGPVSDLLLLLWGRVPVDDVDVVGQRDVLSRFLASL